MKKAILISTVVLSFAVYSFAQTAETEMGIKFNHSSWSEIVAEAKKEHKIIFLDAYASWCGPCKWMAKNVFTNEEAAAYYNQTFVCAKIDMEKGEGIELAKKYNVKSYPTLLYIDENETMVHRTCGVEYTTEFASVFIQDGKNAASPEKRFATLRKSFESNSNFTNTLAYVSALERGCLPYDTELKRYFETQKESSLASSENWGMISKFVNDPSSREFNFLLANKEAFAKQHTQDSVNEKILSVYDEGLYKAIKSKNDQDYLALKKKIESAGIKSGEEILLKNDMDYYQNKKDWNNYALSAVAYLDKYGKNNAQELNSAAWTFYEQVTDRTMLQHAESWVQQAVQIKNIYAFNDTYAAVLYKLGKKQQAQDAAEKAIEIAKQEKSDYQSTSELLEKIKSMK